MQVQGSIVGDHPLSARVDIHPIGPCKSDEGQSALLGQVNGQTGWRPDGDQDRDPGQQGLLDQFKTGPPTQDHHRRIGLQLWLADQAADQLVHGIVPTHVLPQQEQGPVSIEQSAGMNPSGQGKERLLLAQLVGQLLEKRPFDARFQREQVTVQGFHDRVDRGLAADAATGIHGAGAL